MLLDHEVVATLAVKDLQEAARFYEGILGMKKQGPDSSEVLTYVSGKSKLFVYKSQFARTNQATGATWVASDDIDEIVRDLAAKGVKFEHYDLPGLTREGDLHVHGQFKAAWFKDPDGNILQIVKG